MLIVLFDQMVPQYHGGAQESVQRVPVVFWMPGARPTAPMDGRAHALRR